MDMKQLATELNSGGFTIDNAADVLGRDMSNAEVVEVELHLMNNPFCAKTAKQYQQSDRHTWGGQLL